MLSGPKQLQDPKEKPGSTGASCGTWPTTHISKGTGMSHAGKLFSRKVPVGRHLQQSPSSSANWTFLTTGLGFFDRNINIAEKEINTHQGYTHCVPCCYLNEQTNSSQNKVKDNRQMPKAVATDIEVSKLPSQKVTS